MMENKHVYGCLRRIDPHSPSSQWLSNLVRDEKGHIYTVLLSKSRIIYPSEFTILAKKYPENNIQICEYYIKKENGNSKYIEIIRVIDNIKHELSRLKSLSKKAQIQNTKDADRATVTQEFMAKLKRDGIDNAMWLYWASPEEFEKKYWRADVSTILWKTDRPKWYHLRKRDLKALAITFWWDIISDIKLYLSQKAGIRDLQSLIEYGPVEFDIVFGQELMTLLDKDLGGPTEKSLLAFWELLWWKLSDLIKTQLKKYHISTWLDILKAPSSVLESMRDHIGSFLNISMNHSTLTVRYLLCEKLWYDIAVEISRHISWRKGNMYETIKWLWFGDSTIKIVYHYLAKIKWLLNYDPIDIMKTEIKNELKLHYAIVDKETYMHNITIQEIRSLGKWILWLCLGHTIRNVNKKEKIELWQKLWYL